MDRSLRVTAAMLAVLDMLMTNGRAMYPLEITRASGVHSGTAAPLLTRLAAAGWLTEEWEEATVVSRGRPRRHYYRIASAARPHIHQLLLERASAPGYTPRAKAGGKRARPDFTELEAKAILDALSEALAGEWMETLGTDEANALLRAEVKLRTALRSARPY